MFCNTNGKLVQVWLIRYLASLNKWKVQICKIPRRLKPLFADRSTIPTCSYELEPQKNVLETFTKNEITKRTVMILAKHSIIFSSSRNTYLVFAVAYC